MWIDDDILKRCSEAVAVQCFVPGSPAVVLGSSNQADSETDVARCAADGVPVLKRYGGGGTVLLYDGCVVVSVGAWVRQHFQNGLYFRLMNQSVIDCLAERWPTCTTLTQRGLSDIASGDRKLAGTSLFRSRNYLLYQASLLVVTDAARIGLYLRHPTREPDYRQGRTHASFLMGLSEFVGGATAFEVCDVLTRGIDSHVRRLLADECVTPVPEQFRSLLERANAHG